MKAAAIPKRAALAIGTRFDLDKCWKRESRLRMLVTKVGVVANLHSIFRPTYLVHLIHFRHIHRIHCVRNRFRMNYTRPGDLPLLPVHTVPVVDRNHNQYSKCHSIL